ncbi:phosphoglucosamine mutase [Parachlamydia acanthamoebae]|uniref:Phosphoglucosamine mutase n=1 Tax=Parachlamydia acanthamoebae TaxID=83552 RepID=A0A0C1EJJ6_9BACT|nr:phosphoglucosamine mutase [Parachlamydia acanthamoebae]KIA76729.1 Phosphoglucosamine mutase [Parachlamydia acanthamoebae]
MKDRTKSEKIFGTDGVRGKANRSPMTVETALALGRAAGKIFRSHEGKHRVVIGKDTRLSCYMFENALISGLCSMGVDTLMVGPLPTPGVAFITRAYRADAGIVISASHNPYYDNGIKFFSSDGFKLPDTWEKQMEELVSTNNFDDSLPADHDIGKNFKVTDADGRYIEFAKATFPRRLSLKNLTIALDCANGAGYKVAPLIFRELDAKVFVYGNNPDGLNINLQCGSLYPETIQKAVIEHRADVGIALDGDADRVIMVDENAQIIDGDTILAICAKDMQRRGILKGNKVVSTVMSNFGFVKAMEELGIEVIKSQVGDRYVIQDMLEHDANLGGEQSGHLIFLDHNTTGDGLVCALQVMRIMIETDSKLSDLAALVKKYPQVCVNVKVSSKPTFEALPGVNQKVAEVEEILGDSGRVLLRYSGTENICRVMVEGPKLQQVQQLANQIADEVRKQIGTPEK